MSNPLITDELLSFLEQREFLDVATANLDGKPRVAPKFLIKVTSSHIYVADFVIGNIYDNLKVNPQVSLSAMDVDNLTGYEINGMVELLDSGKEYDEITENLQNKEMEHCVTRFIEGVRQQKVLRAFEVAFPDHFVVFKVKVNEVLKIGPSGSLERNTFARENQ